MSNYRRYLKKKLQQPYALVDIGYHGNIQHRIGKIMNQNTTGFYFFCDLTPENTNLTNCKMNGCFQEDNDLSGEQSSLRNHPQFLESLFTAPYGMIIRVDENGNKECADESLNQKTFGQRRKINKGIVSYMQDVLYIAEQLQCMKLFVKKIVKNRIFADRLFRVMKDGTEFNKDISDLFYWEDIIVQETQHPVLG